MSNLYSNLHNLYSISRTLRFELIPVGNTLVRFQENILKQDEIRNQCFKKVKSYCDTYHKHFIDECLSQIDSSQLIENLQKYKQLVSVINQESDKEKKRKLQDSLTKIEDTLRKLIVSYFKQHTNYNDLHKKEMITKLLPDYFHNDKEKLTDIASFKEFTTYFTGYNQNRKNIYTEEKKSTAIAFRLINQNLPLYIKNITSFEKIIKSIPDIDKEIKSILDIDIVEMFSNIENYTTFLTQRQIEKYNEAISGRAEEGKKLQGINEIINLYNQSNSNKLPKLTMLYKQILSDRSTTSFIFDVIETDEQLIQLLNTYYENDFLQIVDNCINTVMHINQFDTSKIYINNDTTLTSLSQQLFSDWNYINTLMFQDIEANTTSKHKSEEKIQKQLEKETEVSLEYIQFLISKYSDNISQNIFSHIQEKITVYKTNIDEAYKKYKPIIQKYTNSINQLIQNEDDITIIKELLDSLKEFQYFIKVFIPKNSAIETDERFYTGLHYNILQEIIPLYNKSRNYLTKKPYSTEKIKLTFNCPELMNGWDINKEKNYLSILLRKKDKYYIGIYNKEKKPKVLLENSIHDNSTNYYEKMEYKLFSDISKMIPKCAMTKEVKQHFSNSTNNYSLFNKNTYDKPVIITKEIFDIYTQEKFKLDYLNNTQDKAGYKYAVHLWIQFVLDFLTSYKSTSIYDISTYKPEEYESVHDFYQDIGNKLYRIQWNNISEKYIDTLVSDGCLFLFELYSKDFSIYSKGKPNLHTMYWKALFDKDNLLKETIYKLNGNAEIFYRKKSLIYDEKILAQGHHYEELKNKFEYPIIKNRRYTTDKFLFHVSVTANYTPQNKKNINEIVNTSIKNEQNLHIIGIDRGERHLIYIAVINLKGEIVEQFSLNEIINTYKGKEYSTNYHELLDKKEKEREKARLNWTTISKIKDLKEGYMSQVIHKIIELMYKYQAVIVLEDLNLGFKNSRKKIEKQVYDKFENMLINKLSYLVSKDKDKYEPGGLFNAYQLVNMEQTNNKQSGILFYISAWNTSNIDPTTGFVNLFNLSITTVDKFKEFIKNFTDIQFNTQEGYFEFSFDYSNFTQKAEGTRTSWVLCSYGTRIKQFKDKTTHIWSTEEVNLTQEFKILFVKYNIDITNIKESLINNSNSEVKKNFIYLFKLMLQMRNSIPNSSIDYILSPVKNANGTFYDSRINIDALPKNADANGAYNIARKGLLLIERIKNTDNTDNLNKIDYSISNKEWLLFAQK